MNHPLPPRDERAFFYSQFSFLRKNKIQLTKEFLASLNDRFGTQAHIFIHFLEWDSNYFNCPVYKIEFIDWPDNQMTSPQDLLVKTLIDLKTELALRHPHYYLFAEIPSEDIYVLQAMSLAGLKLVETRLTYFFNDLKNYTWPERFSTRLATTDDIPNLRNVASGSRNNFDRYHADPFFSDIIADNYLETFVENSVKGFADFVLVPGDDGKSPDAFITVKIENDMAKIVLVAVNEACRGWFLRLTSELIFRLKTQNITYIHMTTQSTNRAVIHVFEKLGWKYGRSSHMFSTYQ
jgi:dTDP-4-amino-4,6-dideoxy-D-galactose acyltransferase